MFAYSWGWSFSSLSQNQRHFESQTGSSFIILLYLCSHRTLSTCFYFGSGRPARVQESGRSYLKPTVVSWLPPFWECPGMSCRMQPPLFHREAVLLFLKWLISPRGQEAAELCTFWATQVPRIMQAWAQIIYPSTRLPYPAKPLILGGARLAGVWKESRVQLIRKHRIAPGRNRMSAAEVAWKPQGENWHPPPSMLWSLKSNGKDIVSPERRTIYESWTWGKSFPLSDSRYLTWNKGC